MHCYEDPEAEPLRRSIERVVGLSCFEWCSGHGVDPFRVRFTAKQAQDLAPIVCWMPPLWRVEAEIQFDGKITFLLEGPPTTPDAWKDLEAFYKSIRINRLKK